MTKRELGLGVDEQWGGLGDPLKWKEAEWSEVMGIGVHIPCSHPRCRMKKTIGCYSPIQLRYAKKAAAHEVYYCHRHRSTAWEKTEDISDYLLPFLQKIKKLRVCNKAKSGLRQEDINFLLEIGQISLEPVQRGANVVYQIKTTERGEQHLGKHAARLTQYLSWQVKDHQLEWNWVPSNTMW